MLAFSPGGGKQMNQTRIVMEAVLPEVRRVLRLMTTIIIFSMFFVVGVIIDIVEGAFVYEEIGYISFTPLLICGLTLTLVSTLVLGYVFLTKNWFMQVEKKNNKRTFPPPFPPQYPPTVRPPEQHGYRPYDNSLLIVLFLSCFAIPVQADTWNGYNNPANMDLDHDYVYRLDQIPSQSSLERLPWSESYWPSYMGSINQRWNTVNKDGFYYRTFSKAEVMKMSLDELKILSPSEKYDLYMGRYDYPLYHEVRYYGDPGAPAWHGICDGWAIAAIQYAEPMPVMVINPDGLVIPFGSSDVKALMSFAAVSQFKVETRQVGLKCNWGGSGCTDINPGSLHVILGNQIGIKKKGFITERESGREIWNQPTYGYEFKIMGSVNSNFSDHGVRVHGTLYYTDELETSSWEPVVGTPKFKFNKLEMDYILDLDSKDNIVGGTWMGGSDRADFVWLPVNHLIFKQSLAGINDLYRPAL